MTTKPVKAPIGRTAVIWQLIAILAVVLPLINWLPGWVLLLGLGCVGARLMIHSGRWSFPHWSLRLLLILGVGIGLVMTYSMDTSLEAMMTLLTAGLLLKLLEIYHRRDALVLLYIALFLSGAVFLFEQSLLVSFYQFFAVSLVVAALISIWQNPLRADLLDPWRLAWRLLLPALPLMLVLFFIFPRIDPLWSVSLDRSSASTGLSENLSPGDISRLTRSDALAFRAVFETEPPAPAARYWRALVLSSFDGRAWSLAPAPETSVETLTPLAEPIHYEIVQESSHQRWLFALDVPASAPVQGRLTAARTLQADREVTSRTQYLLASAKSYRLGDKLSPATQDFFTRLPRASNPRSQALAQTWFKQEDQDISRLIDRIFAHFNQQFVYTLEPQPLGRHSVDDFLFETQQGFCEHYASATAFLLRSVDVPARVVTGYLGGEWNSAQNYLTLRQYDAHAWVEVWIEDQGWVRIDPTAAVAPERIAMSADQLFSGQAGFLADSPLTSRMGRHPWLLQARLRYDALNFAWQRWVLNYHHQQDGLLERWFGALSPWKIYVAILLPTSLVLGFLAWFLLGRKPQRDPLTVAQHKLLRQLQRLGIQRQADETFAGLIQRIRPSQPAIGQLLEPVASAYEAHHYASAHSGDSRRTLLAALHQAHKQLQQVKPHPLREAKSE